MSYSASRKQVGLEGENYVKPILEKLWNEELNKTPKENDIFDFETANRWIEVKRRLPPYSSSDKYFEEGAFIPFCKIVRALEEEKPVYFYYYFDSDKTLWELQFDPKFLELFKPFVPRRHSTRQPHISVPKSYWKRIEYNPA